MSLRVIYEPRGRAREYAELAASLYRNCEHGCKYCFVPGVLHCKPEQFHDGASPRPDVLHQFERDCTRLEASGASVLLSFTTDPYQPIDDKYHLTREAIKVLHAHGLFVQILTKGGHRAERDFDLLGDGDAFATTLTFLDATDSCEWEPFAAPPQDRIDSIRTAHSRGITTWVSLEPVIDPEQTLELIRHTHKYVDVYKVGRLNHHPLAKAINWSKFAREAVTLLKSLGKQYYIKADLRQYLQEAK